MRIIVDLPNEQIKALDSLGKSQNLPRAELVRRAVDLYLAEEKKLRSDAAIDKYHGFLKDVPAAFDGLDADEYVQKVRGEWEPRDEMYSRWAMHDEGGAAYKDQNKDKS